MSDETKTPAVYAAWAGVCEDMARGGIGKGRQAPASVGGYAFRGIDEVLLALSASYVRNKLGVRADFGDRKVDVVARNEGKRMEYVAITGAFTLYSFVDGSSVGPFAFVGEGMDTGDKATNKAMSIAYKYFAIQTFAIPTKGVLDDEEPNAPEEPKPQPNRNSAPEVYRLGKNFGGELVTEASAETLARALNAANAVLNDRERERQHDAARKAADAIEAELAARVKEGR